MRKSSQLLAVTGAVALFAGALVLALPAQAKQTGKPAVQVGCQHSITFQQLDSSFQATQIRVKPYGGGANIGSAIAPAGWTVTTSPTGAVFKLQGGGVISVGSHSGFSINLGSTSQAHQYVLVEWMTAEGEVICGQPLYVPCGAVQARSVREAAVPAAPIYSGPICGCLNASTEADDTSDILDTDIDVNIVQIVNAGFLKFNVLYTLELDPINTPITKTWQLIAFDETGNEAVLSIQPTADTYDPQSGQWQATFTVTDGWDFDVTLSVTSKLACLNNPEGSRESAEDEDTGSYRANGVPSEIEVTPSDPCDPYKYVFTDVTDPVGTQPIVWTVAQTGYAPQAVPPDSSGSYTYSFPNGNVPYDVCLVATDPTSSVPRPMVCEQVTPATGSLNVKFQWEDYDSCPIKNFIVKFKNKTKNVKCPVEWKWDFGDGTPFSTDKNPTHTYVNPGNYKVTLSAAGSQAVNTITVAHWEPTIAPAVNCGDGSVLWSTQDGTLLFGRKWTPSGGDYSLFKRRSKKLRVCYSNIGGYTMTLWARNNDGGNCSSTASVKIDTIVRCCRRDKTSSVDLFNVGGTQYRMKSKFRYRGAPGRLFAKTKLQVLKNGIWWRKRADSIAASFSGAVFTKSGDCLCVSPHTIPVTGNQKSKRAKVSKFLMPGVGTLRAKQGGLTSTHSVTIGGQTHTKALTLWLNDCGCTWKN